jgi:hypothetical protein
VQHFALMVDGGGVLQAASLDDTLEPGWQEIYSVGNASLVPTSNVATLQCSISLVVALIVDANGVLNIYTNDASDSEGWRGPETVGGATLQPGGNVVVFRQSPSVVTALTIDRFGVLNRASQDQSLGNSWQGMDTIGGSRLVPGSPIAICTLNDSVFAALVVDATGLLNVATLDLGKGAEWQGLDIVGSPAFAPGTPVSVV